MIGRFDGFASAFINLNSKVIPSSNGGLGPTPPTQILRAKTSLIRPENMTEELYAQFLVSSGKYATREEALRHVPFFGFSKRSFCERIRNALSNDRSGEAVLANAQAMRGARNDVIGERKHVQRNHGGTFNKLLRLFIRNMPAKSKLIHEFNGASKGSQKLQENLRCLIMIGAGESEKAGHTRGNSNAHARIKREFFSNEKKILEFICQQNAKDSKLCGKILSALASKDCTAVMGLLLAAVRMQSNPALAKQLQTDPNLINKLINSAITALRSKNNEVAASVCIHAQEMGISLTSTFFDDLCRKPTPGRSYANMDAEAFIQQHETTAVNSNFGSEAATKEMIITFLEGPEVGVNFFADEKFQDKLDLAAQQLAGLILFKDMTRNFQHWEMVIDGKILTFGGCPRNSSEGAAKFFLQKLKNSGLTPEASFNALKSLCRYAWIQGEATRPVTAFAEELQKSPPNELRDFGSFIMSSVTKTNNNRTRFEFFPNGNLKISSMFVVGSDVIGSKENMEHFSEVHANDTDAGQRSDLSKCYLTAFTSIECTPEGHHTILDSMMACHR
jgi:hypothetical protein